MSEPPLIDLRSLHSTASVVFTADEPVVGGVFPKRTADGLLKRLQAREFGYTPGERPMWMVRKGSIALSPSRDVLIESIVGSENELGVTVDGATEDAIDVLREVWAILCDLGGRREVPDVSELGTYIYQTVSVAKFPKSFDQLIPAVTILRREGLARIGPTGDQHGAAFHRVSTRIRIVVGSIIQDRELVLEPRFTSEIEDRIFYAATPLRSEDHIATLEALCQGLGPA